MLKIKAFYTGYQIGTIAAMIALGGPVPAWASSPVALATPSPASEATKATATATAAATAAPAPALSPARLAPAPAPDKTAVLTPAPAAAPAQSAIPLIIGDMQTTTTKYEDTLVHLARRYNVGFVELRAANPGIDPWLPGAGTKITIPTQHLLPNAVHNGVVINLSEMRLYFYTKDGEEPTSYPIGIGRNGLTTPLGATTIARMTIDPVWFPTERMRKEDPKLPAVVPPGPENPMGTHAMYLGWDSYAIHGTDKPYSIGRRLSSGCIRMYPEDIITLFNNVQVGTPVTVVDQPVKTAWIGNQFYIEVHPTQEQSDILSHDNAQDPVYTLNEADMRTILAAAGTEDDINLDWAKIRSAVKERRGVPLVVGTRSGDHGEGHSAAQVTSGTTPKI